MPSTFYAYVPGEGLVQIPGLPVVPPLKHISDEMRPTVHPCDGRTYTSQSRFRSVTRAFGKIEAGNEFVNGGFKPRQDEDIPGFRDDFVDALETCRSMSSREREALRNPPFVPELDGPDA